MDGAGDLMLSAPYPIPVLRTYKVAMVIGWAAGIAAGAWVLLDPPLSYQGIGLMLTIAWGAMLVIGSALVTLGHIGRRYKVELPGLVLALGGVVIYDYLSWQQTLSGSSGSGPRSLILVLLACVLIGRIRVLLYLDKQARHLVETRESTA